MANELEKYEGRITIPTGGYTVSLQEFTPNGGPYTVTIPAGDYFLTSAVGSNSLLAEFKAQLDAADADSTYTVTLSDTDTAATGKVTISVSGVTTFNITWTSTTLRDLLGFTADLSGAATYTGTEHAEFLWLPNVTTDSPEFVIGDKGWQVSDYTVSVAPSGQSKRLAYARRYAGVVHYLNLIARKTWISKEATVNESLEKFWQDVIQPGKAVRFHRDRSVDATYVNWVLTSGGVFRPVPTIAGWQGTNSLWAWESDLIEAV